MRSLTLLAAAALLTTASVAAAQDIAPNLARPPSSDEVPEPEATPAPEATTETPAPEQDQARWKPTTHPRLYMFTDDANFLPPGWLEAELAYNVLFSEFNGQLLTTMAKMSPRQGLELRLGWDTLGVVETGGGDPVTGVGDLYGESKFAIDLGPNVDANMHRLAALVQVRPGIGQPPVTVPGVGLAGYAVYTTYPGYVQVNAQAGLATNVGSDSDLVLNMPLSGSVGYQALSWLRVHGELIENLNLRDLSSSGTRVLGNGRWIASPFFSVDLGIALGLSAQYPDAVIYGAVTWRAMALD